MMSESGMAGQRPAIIGRAQMVGAACRFAVLMLDPPTPGANAAAQLFRSHFVVRSTGGTGKSCGRVLAVAARQPCARGRDSISAEA
jgi:hypothetical protein